MLEMLFTKLLRAINNCYSFIQILKMKVDFTGTWLNTWESITEIPHKSSTTGRKNKNICLGVNTQKTAFNPL